MPLVLGRSGNQVSQFVGNSVTKSHRGRDLVRICKLFDSREKQALLECTTLQQRAETLTALLQMGVFDSSGKPDGPRQ